MNERVGEPDRERWDRKYAAGEGPAHFDPNPLLVEHRRLLSGGRAFDAACGFGGNTLYLASLDYQVDAVDVSGVALLRARTEALRRGLKIQLVQADLMRWWVPPDRYDLILVFGYLNRALLPQLAAGLRPGGLLFETNRNEQYLAVRPDFDPDYLVAAGELHRLASGVGLETVFYSDGTPEVPHTSVLIAQKAA